MANTISSGREKRGSEWKVLSAAIAMIRHFLSRVQRSNVETNVGGKVQASIEQATKGPKGFWVVLKQRFFVFLCSYE